jgi:HEAT repeat protein
MLRRGDSPYEQQVAAQSLANIGAPAVAALIDLLVCDEGAAGQAAASALLQHYRWTGHGRTAGENLPGDPTASARQQAIEMLGASGRADEVVIKVLAGAAQDSAPGVRLTALKALAHANSNLQPALPQLVACSHDESPAIREWSARTLGKIGPPAKRAIPALTRLAQDKEESVRVVAQQALEAINAGSATNMPAPPKYNADY